MKPTNAPIPIYQIDAFADRIFAGNPAAVCPLDHWLPDALLQSIAAENNLSETAFFVETGTSLYDIRWFTPTREVALCGHATLATAHVIFEELSHPHDRIQLDTRHSGPLIVQRRGDGIELDFPAIPLQRSEPSLELIEALGAEPVELFENAEDHLAIFESESQVRGISPDFDALIALGKTTGCVVTAVGDSPDVDYVCRYFAPGSGIPEDPVTGSAQCRLAPIWAAKLGKNRMRSRQISRRGGELQVEVRDGRVAIEGKTVLYLRGSIHPPR